MMEIWKKITNYEGLYEVSNFGNVRSVGRHYYNKGVSMVKKPCVLKGSVTKKGYLQYCLRKDGKEKSILAHKLVAVEFVNGDNSLTVNHIDGNKLNNHYLNLEWITIAQNVKHAWDNGLCLELKKNLLNRVHANGKISSEKNSIPVGKFKDNVLIETFPNMRRASESIGVDYRNLFRAMKSGKVYHGFVFKKIQ